MSGVIALLSPDNTLHIIDMPTVKVPVAGKLRGQIDMYALITALRALPALPEIVVVEELHSRPQQSAQSQFSLGGSFYVARMIGPVLSIPTHLVLPQTWQKAMRVKSDPSGNTKGCSRERAQQIFPNQAQLFSRVKDDGRADAALMAFYGREFAL